MKIVVLNVKCEGMEQKNFLKNWYVMPKKLQNSRTMEGHIDMDNTQNKFIGIFCRCWDITVSISTSSIINRFSRVFFTTRLFEILYVIYKCLHHYFRILTYSICFLSFFPGFTTHSTLWWYVDTFHEAKHLAK